MIFSRSDQGGKRIRAVSCWTGFALSVADVFTMDFYHSGITTVVIINCLFMALFSNPRAEAQSWQIVGQTGGRIRAARVLNNIAYTGVGARLAALDISNPSAPAARGATRPFPHDVEAIAVERMIAYVAVGGAGLRVVDVSDPDNPFESGAWDSPGYGEGVAVAGSTVYLADGPHGLRLVDVSDPTKPVETGYAYPMNYVLDVAVSGDYAYLAAAGAGLLVVDVSDPADPRETASFDTPGHAYGVALSDGKAYVADAWEGLRVVDVSNPSNPVSIGACDTPGWALDVAVEGPRAYVADGANGLRVLDVSNLSNIHEIGAHDVSGLGRRVALADGAAYLVDLLGGLHLLNVMDPAQPTVMGRYRSMADARRVALSGSHAYVVTGSACEMRIVDVSDQTRPRVVGVYDTNGGYAGDVVVGGSHAFVATYGAGASEESLGGTCSLHVLDISNPAHPTRIGGISTSGAYRQIALVGDLVYVADEWGVRVISVADPSNPVEIGFFRTFYETRETVGIALSGSLAYLAASLGGVVIVDISDPSNMKLVGACDLEDFVLEVAVAGDTIYAAAADGLYVVDVSDPETPTMVGGYDTPGVAYGVTVSGNTAYVSDGGGGVQVLDIENYASPTLMETWETPGFAYDASPKGNYAYVADGPGGLLIMERTGKTMVQKRLKPEPTAHPGQTFKGPKRAENPIYSRPVFTNRFLRRARARTGKAAKRIRGRGIDSGNHHFSTRGATHADKRQSRGEGPCIVTSAADAGPGSLRECMMTAGGGDAITFDPEVFPPGAPVSIRLASQLPSLTLGNQTIDASNSGVIIDGAGAPAGAMGLLVESSVNTIKGLQILGFPEHGILLSGNQNIIGGDRSVGSGPTGEGNVISGCGGIGLSIYGSDNLILGNFIGTDALGSMANGNEIVGVQLSGAGNIVGGTAGGEKNVISGNSEAGIQIQDTGTMNNTIIGNFIGTDITGTVALGNGSGICLVSGASHNKVGGATPRERNIISGNQESGIGFILEGVEANVVMGNFIGVDVTGTRALGNGREGVIIQEGPCNNIIGGANPGEGNIISGNKNVGVIIAGAIGVFQNTVIGNIIGADVTGAAPLGNALGGVLIWGWGFNRIGGETSGERNIISGNNGPGVSIGGSVIYDSLVLGNYIGLDVTGARAIGNETGVAINEGMRHSFVGGATVGERNIISGNGVGVLICQAGIEYNWIIGNYIGTSANGLEALGNYFGVLLDDHASHNIVQKNLISGNSEAGVRIQTNARFNLLRANHIGPSAAGVSGFPTGNCGVRIEAPSNTVGGAYPGDGNLIAFNNGDGVQILNHGGNRIQNNIIERNSGMGIDASVVSSVINNKITENQSYGVRAAFLESFTENDIYNNAIYDFYYHGSAGQTAINNYWGTTASSVIETMIYDYTDDSGAGIVVYEPFAVKPFFSAPPPPTLTMSTNATSITISWSLAPNAEGYVFLYAPYPDVSYIGEINVGNLTGPFTLELWSGAAFYIAVFAYNNFGDGNLSNIEYFVLP